MIAHLPTFFLLIGLPLYWLMFLTHTASDGVTGILSWLVLIAVGLMYGYLNIQPVLGVCRQLKIAFCQMTRFNQALCILSALVVLSIIAVIGYAASFPIHLNQEFDTLNYHYTLPRQHLITGSFALIPWAADDLFLLPIQYALAPFWFATMWLNKWPQFIFCLGLWLLLIRIVWRSSPGIWGALLVSLAFWGSHGLGIQMGTAMLDLVICYLAIAAIDSFSQGKWLLGTTEAVFLFWAKPLMPPLLIFVLCMVAIFLIIANRSKWHIDYRPFFSMEQLKTFPYRIISMVAVVLSIAVAGPFIVKSLMYTGSPVYPLWPGLMGQPQIVVSAVHWHSVQAASVQWIDGVKEGYGYGRSLIDFFYHWWRLAVPEGGVNNRFDYPLGLPLLLMIVPFCVLMVKSLRERRIILIGLIITIWWLIWWMGSQQARFLYIPYILMIVMIVMYLKSSRILIGCLMIACSLNSFSLVRAHYHDWGKHPLEVLRPQDQTIIHMNEQYLILKRKDMQTMDVHDIAYAQFPAIVLKEKLPHTTGF